MGRIKHNFEGVTVTIKDKTKTLFNERRIGGNEYHTKSILKAISESASQFEILVGGGNLRNSTALQEESMTMISDEGEVIDNMGGVCKSPEKN